MLKYGDFRTFIPYNVASWTHPSFFKKTAFYHLPLHFFFLGRQDEKIPTPPKKKIKKGKK
jgi:hypothetical protein